MDSSRFDELTKALVTSTSRRQALKTIAATTLGGILGLSGLGTAFGATTCHRNGLGCDTNSQCCSGYCANGEKCTCPPAPACNSYCPCPSGQTCCNGTCINSQTDVNNCGACGHVCSFPDASAACSGGTCVLVACNAGFGNCDGNAANGCETNLQTDAQNCGQCGHICASGETCVSGACTCGSAGDCPNGQNCCNGVCVDEQTNINNCGSCGHACASGQVCQNGTCVTTCTALGGTCSVRSDCCLGGCPNGKCCIGDGGFGCNTSADCCSGTSCFGSTGNNDGFCSV